MGKGLPKKYAKMGFKKGWAAYKKTKSGRKKSTTKKSPKRTYTKRRKTYMARRKKRGSRKQGIVSLALNGTALAIALAPAAVNAKNHLFAGDYQGFADSMMRDYTGISHDGDSVGFNPMAAKGLWAVGGAILFRKGTGMLMKHVKIKL
jgi:hypothetical protein